MATDNSTLSTAAIESILSQSNLYGLVPSSSVWSISLLDQLYQSVCASTFETFPPTGFVSTKRYVAISYVQAAHPDGSLSPPLGWSNTVFNVLTQIEKEDETRYGIWFDKMGNRQFPTLQSFWGPIANLQYAAKLVIHVSPTVQQHHHQLLEKAACGLTLQASQIISSWFVHHSQCKQCLHHWNQSLNDICPDSDNVKLPPEKWTHPDAYYRCWPMVERALAVCNQGLLTDAHALKSMLCSVIALCTLLKTKNDHGTQTSMFEEQPPHNAASKYLVLSHHFLQTVYDCSEAIDLSRQFPLAFEDTLKMMADRMCVDITKIEPFGISDKYYIANHLRGLSQRMSIQMIPLYARDMLRRHGVSSQEVDLSIARQDIMTSWAGRASCYSDGDKIAIIVLFANFRLATQMITQHGEDWLRELVNLLYENDVGLFNEEMLPSPMHSVGYDTYTIFHASVGQCTRNSDGADEHLPETASLFGRYSGCITRGAFEAFLEQCGKTDKLKHLLDFENLLWKNHVEFEGAFFMRPHHQLRINPQQLQQQSDICPACEPSKHDQIGTIWRSIHGSGYQRNIWILGHEHLQSSNETDISQRNDLIQHLSSAMLLATGRVHLDPERTLKCERCQSVVQLHSFRGWPKQDHQQWTAVLVPEMRFRPSPSKPILSQIGGAQTIP